MPQARWTNPSQPQTLQIAVFLLYANAFLAGLNMLRYNISPFDLLSVPWGAVYVGGLVAGVFAGRAIAGERRWGYYLGIAAAVSPFLSRLVAHGQVNGMVQVDLLELMFEVALLVLLLHVQSREYQRIWFK